ncbi:amidohydrolase family protein [Flaviaesturariibacter terrae]
MRLLVSASLLLLATVVAAQPANRPVRRIIDVHLHARGWTQYGTPPAANPVTAVAPRWSSDAEVMKATRDSLRRWGVVRAIVSGTPARAAAFRQYDSALFIPALDYGDDASNPLPDTSAFRDLFLRQGFRVFGELALQYDGKLLTDPELEPYLAICEREGIPVALHTGLGAPGTPSRCCPRFRTLYGNPQMIEETLVRHPRLKLQLMHAGYPFLQETKAILYVYPQVYADIAVINWMLPVTEFHKYLKDLVDAGFSKRLMYGSDQMGWPDAIGLSIRNTEAASFLTAEQKQDIFYNNAARFYGIR